MHISLAILFTFDYHILHHKAFRLVCAYIHIAYVCFMQLSLSKTILQLLDKKGSQLFTIYIVGEQTTTTSLESYP